MIDTTVRTLHGLIGHDWDQFGDAVFFVLGAYRDANDKTVMFKLSSFYYQHSFL